MTITLHLLDYGLALPTWDIMILCLVVAAWRMR